MHRVQDVTHLGIRGDGFELVNGLQVGRFLKSVPFELEHGGILEGVHGESSHECIFHSDPGSAATSIIDLLKGIVDSLDEGIGTEMLTLRGAERFISRCFVLSEKLPLVHGT